MPPKRKRAISLASSNNVTEGTALPPVHGNVPRNKEGKRSIDIEEGKFADRALADDEDSPLSSPLESERLDAGSSRNMFFSETQTEGAKDNKAKAVAEKKRREKVVKGRENTISARQNGKKLTVNAKKASNALGAEHEEFIPPPEKRKKRVKKGKEEQYDCSEMPVDTNSSVERLLAINSEYLPLPWKGRLGYACLNTYLRTSNPPIFCSRTCRIDTILKHGKEGQKYVESLGLANAKDLKKLIEFNGKYGIKFLRISSEMFPFASHENYGYSLEFAEEALAEAGAVAMKYGQRLSMHPGQYTQLGSPRKEVVAAAVRDLEYHNQLLKFLGLKGQADKDAVLVIHMGGVFGDKKATLQRFRENYTCLLSNEIKARLVLENDDMCWPVHDLLPICKELNIPLVLDWHHHNIVHDPSMREGTLDILQLIPEIKETWTRKGITQKQHYSEPKENNGNVMQRRRHSARVKTLPPCEPDMDLMIEAKDKEQSVFELMRAFKLEGYEKIRDMIPHERQDENKPERRGKTAVKGKARRRRKGNAKDKVQAGEEEAIEEGNCTGAAASGHFVSEEEVGMGGPEGRVYWPEGMEYWLSPPKKSCKKEEGKEEVGVDPTAKQSEVDKETKGAKQAMDSSKKSEKDIKNKNTIATQQIAQLQNAESLIKNGEVFKNQSTMRKSTKAANQAPVSSGDGRHRGIEFPFKSENANLVGEKDSSPFPSTRARSSKSKGFVKLTIAPIPLKVDAVSAVETGEKAAIIGVVKRKSRRAKKKVAYV